MRHTALISRRNFLKHSGFTLAVIPFKTMQGSLATAPSLDPNTLTPFVDPLPVPPLARPAGTRANPDHPSVQVPYYNIAMHEALVKVHRNLPPTRMWTIGNCFPGVTLETRSGEGLIVEWRNELPSRHFLPSDYTLHGAGRNIPEVRSVIHLHGGRTPTQKSAIEWAREAEAWGAGEILLTSMDGDGTQAGYDIPLTRAVAEAVSIPVIASGRAGNVNHIYQALTEGKAEAALVASIVHYGKYTIRQIKEELNARGVEVRI